MANPSIRREDILDIFTALFTEWNSASTKTRLAMQMLGTKSKHFLTGKGEGVIQIDLDQIAELYAEEEQIRRLLLEVAVEIQQASEPASCGLPRDEQPSRGDQAEGELPFHTAR